MTWIVVGYMGKYEDPGVETVASIMLEAFVWMLLGVLMPVWLGRFVRRSVGSGERPRRLPGA